MAGRMAETDELWSDMLNDSTWAAILAASQLPCRLLRPFCQRSFL
jgi:hypothetical protein